MGSYQIVYHFAFPEFASFEFLLFRLFAEPKWIKLNGAFEEPYPLIQLDHCLDVFIYLLHQYLHLRIDLPIHHCLICEIYQPHLNFVSQPVIPIFLFTQDVYLFELGFILLLDFC